MFAFFWINWVAILLGWSNGANDAGKLLAKVSLQCDSVQIFLNVVKRLAVQYCLSRKKSAGIFKLNWCYWSSD